MAKKTETKSYNVVATVFVILNGDGSCHSTQEMPSEDLFEVADVWGADKGRAYRVTLGGYEGADPSITIARMFDFGKDENRKVGFSSKPKWGLGAFPPAAAAELARVLMLLAQTQGVSLAA